MYKYNNKLILFNGKSFRKIPPILVSGVVLNTNTANIAEGDVFQLEAYVVPVNSTNTTLTWSSSNESILTVDGNGLVTAVGVIDDTATITATTQDGGFTDTCIFTIVSAFAEATGGVVTTSGDYKIHTFTGNGILNVSKNSNTNPIEYLVVAGGGGGGGVNNSGSGSIKSAGGGGSGDAIVATLPLTQPQSLTITIGSGGGSYVDGGNTSIIGDNVNIIAYGGGRGGGFNFDTVLPPNTGGGAGGAGTTGGAGRSISLNYNGVVYAIGGAAGTYHTWRNGDSAAANTGSGGQGASVNVATGAGNGGNGGSGIVKIKYKYKESLPVFNGLQSYYKLDEASGTVVSDSINGVNGTASNVTWTGGKIGNAGSFTAASSSLITIPNNAAHNFGVGSFSISAWIKTSTANWGGIVTKRSGDITGWNLNLDISGSNVVANFFTPNNFISSTVPMNTGEWIHVVCVRNILNTNKLAIYINGVLNVEGTTTVSNVDSSVNTVMGRYRSNATGNHYTGLIDEVGIWNRALTLEEIQTLYNSGNGITY